VINRNPG